MGKKKYLKIGEKANCFSDPQSGIDVSNNQVVEMPSFPKNKVNNKVKRALQHGHIQEATEEEYLEYMASIGKGEKPESKKEEDAPKTRKEELEEMTKKELVKLYEDTFEVDEDEVEAFEKLNKDDMIEEIIGLEEEAE